MYRKESLCYAQTMCELREAHNEKLKFINEKERDYEEIQENLCSVIDTGDGTRNEYDVSCGTSDR